MKQLSLVLLITCSWFTQIQFTLAEESAEVVKSINKLAHANDWMSDEVLEEVKRLRSSADELFPVLSQIIETSTDDAVLNTALSIASAATTRKPELSEIAFQVLSNRDASSFPLVTQRALTILGESGDKKYIPLIKKSATSPNLVIRTAAESALASLEESRKNASVSADQLPSAAQQPALKKPTEQKPEPSAPIEESSSSTRWLVAVVIVVVLGLLWLLLKKWK